MHVSCLLHGRFSIKLTVNFKKLTHEYENKSIKYVIKYKYLNEF